MLSVNITEFRSHLPFYLEKVQSGEELRLTSRGKSVARVVGEADEAVKAREWLAAIRGTSSVGDVTTPLDEPWAVLRDST
jgi:prevent-host-death family protein